jgi:hypothetical protein
MEGGTLFNPGFAGGSFNWWIGQIPEDGTWRENIRESKYKRTDQVPGWGYRYKVRIIGKHDQSEGSIKSDQLPWANVMYPVTAGGGLGGSYQTPGIKQGSFVFGFYVDSQDEQVPMILGVLGSFSGVPKSTLNSANGGENFTPQSGNANTGDDPTKVVSDNELTTQQPQGENTPPTKESVDATHQESMADKRKKSVLKKKRPIWCPDPKQTSPLKGIQTIIEDLTERIEKLQSGLQSYVDALNSDINVLNSLINQVNAIDILIKDASCEIAKFLKMLFGLVQDFVTDLFTKVLQPLFNISPPTIRIEAFDKLVKGLELIECLFNSIGIELCASVEKAIKGSFARRSGGRPAPESVQPFLSDQYEDVPWFTFDDGTGSGASGGDDGTGTGAGVTGAGVGGGADSGTGAGTDDDVKTQYNPTPLCYVEDLVGEILGENIIDIITTFEAATLPVVRLIEVSLNDVGGPGSSYAGSTGVKPREQLREQLRQQLSTEFNPLLEEQIESDIIRAERASDPLLPNIPSIPSLPNFDVFGSLGGAGFDIASALNFFSALSSFFSCDLSLICSPNEYHTLQSGGNAAPKEDEPSSVGVAKVAQVRAESGDSGPSARTRTRYRTP